MSGHLCLPAVLPFSPTAAISFQTILEPPASTDINHINFEVVMMGDLGRQVTQQALCYTSNKLCVTPPTSSVLHLQQALLLFPTPTAHDPAQGRSTFRTPPDVYSKFGTENKGALLFTEQIRSLTNAFN
jgi:hypothetical protein